MCLTKYIRKGIAMHKIDDEYSLRMRVWHDHVSDCAGLFEPLPWELFKHRVWVMHSNCWATAFLEAGKLAKKIHERNMQN